MNITVTITETLSRDVVIDAPDKLAAMRSARQLYREGEIELNADNSVVEMEVSFPDSHVPDAVERFAAEMYRAEYTRRKRTCADLEKAEREWAKKNGKESRADVLNANPLEIGRGYALIDADLRGVRPCLLDHLAAIYGTEWASAREREVDRLLPIRGVERIFGFITTGETK